MDVRELLLMQWESCLDKEDWFPPLENALENITLEQAIWKPEEKGMNTIWEIVCHLLFYEKRFMMRFLGETENEPTAENNDATFQIPAKTLENWQETKQEYFRVHRELERLLAESDEEDLYREVRRDNPLVLELKSLAMHNAYHIGQIVFLSKMQGAWPSNRCF